VVGALVAYSREASAMLVRAVDEVARWVSAGELRRRRPAAHTGSWRRAAGPASADSPHFIYNSLTAVASFVRTDPDRPATCSRVRGLHPLRAAPSGRVHDLARSCATPSRYLVLERPASPIGWSSRCTSPRRYCRSRCHSRRAAAGRERRAARPSRATPGVVTSPIHAIDDGPARLISIEDDGPGSDPDVIRSPSCTSRRRRRWAWACRCPAAAGLWRPVRPGVETARPPGRRSVSDTEVSRPACILP